MRSHSPLRDRPRLLGQRQPDPEVVLAGSQRKTRKEQVADEVPPASERRRDSNLGPSGQRVVEATRERGSSRRQDASGRSSSSESAIATVRTACGSTSASSGTHAVREPHSAIDSLCIAMRKDSVISQGG